MLRPGMSDQNETNRPLEIRIGRITIAMGGIGISTAIDIVLHRAAIVSSIEVLIKKSSLRFNKYITVLLNPRLYLKLVSFASYSILWTFYN